MALSPIASQFPFLRHGKPFYDAEDFKKNSPIAVASSASAITSSSSSSSADASSNSKVTLRQYRAWEVVVFVGRWWCTSIRADKIRPPAALLIFGVGDDNNKNSGFSSGDNNNKDLLFATVLDDALPATAAEELKACLSHCPLFYRPTCCRVAYYSQVQHTLDRMRLSRKRRVRAEAKAKGGESTSFITSQTEEAQKVIDLAAKKLNGEPVFFTTSPLARNDSKNTLDGTDAADSTEEVIDLSPLETPVAVNFNAFNIQSDTVAATAAATTDSSDVSPPLPLLSIPFSPSAFMEKVCDWMKNERKMFPDASMQPFTTQRLVGVEEKEGEEKEKKKDSDDEAKRQLPQEEEDPEAVNAINKILALGAQHYELSTMRVAPKKNKNHQEEKEDDLSATNGLVAATFTVPKAYLADNKFPHALILQRPQFVSQKEQRQKMNNNNNQFASSETAAAAASEGVELCPTQPQPVGVELHLHTDPGDAAYVCQILNKPHNVQLYEDLLHPDGEVYVQFGPVEGAAVVDAEAAMKAFAHYNHPQTQEGDMDEKAVWGFPLSSPSSSSPSSPPQSQQTNRHLLRTVGEKSDFAVPVPRVVFNAPSGKTERRTPLEAPKTLLTSHSPNKAMLLAAEAAVRYYVSEMIVKREEETAEAKQQQEEDGGKIAKAPSSVETFYNLNWDKAFLSLEEHNSSSSGSTDIISSSSTTLFTCNFCSRQRLKIMRCGACKVTYYCCKDHQAKDWKGAHKTECKQVKTADDEFQSRVLPAIEKRLQASLATSGCVDQKSRKSLKSLESESNAMTFLKLLSLCKLSAFKCAENKDDDGVDTAFLAKIKQKVAETVKITNANKSGKSDASSSPAGASESGDATSAIEVINIHILNIEDVFGFMAALAEWYSSYDNGNKDNNDNKSRFQYRIILANSKSITASENNKVYALKQKKKAENGDATSSTSFAFSEVESTGVLGDLWRVSSSASSPAGAATSPFLVRLYHDRYHNCAEKIFSSPLLAPHAVFSIGPKTREGGQPFFNASTEVIVDDVLTQGIPFAFAEPHYLAAGRTVSAIQNRITLSPAVKAKFNNNPALLTFDDSNGLVNAAAVNEFGICPLPIREDDDGNDGDGGENESTKKADATTATGLVANKADDDEDRSTANGGVTSRRGVPLHLNAYISVMLPKV